MKAFLLKLWRMLEGVCPACGGHLNRVDGFGPSHARRIDGVYIWCPSCHAGCARCANED